MQNPTKISTPDGQTYFENLNILTTAHQLTAYDYELLSKITMVSLNYLIAYINKCSITVNFLTAKNFTIKNPLTLGIIKVIKF